MAISQVRQHEEVKKQQPILRTAESFCHVDAMSHTVKKYTHRRNLAQRGVILNISPSQPSQNSVVNVVRHRNTHGLSALQKMLNA